MGFSELDLSPEVLQAVSDAGYTTPTPIQEQAIPHVKSARDVLGCAQTGTGKTASFVLPMIDMLAAGRVAGADAALADPRTDARAGDPGRRVVRALRQIPPPDDGAADRRRKLCRSGAQARSRRRRADRHTRPPARPVRARQDPVVGCAHPGHRRGRPDARHGLHPRCRAHRRPAAEEPADPVLLGDDAGRNPQARRRLSQQPGGDRGGAAGLAGRTGGPVARRRRPARQARGAAPPDRAPKTSRTR